MSGYFLIIITLWVLTFLLVKTFDLEIASNETYRKLIPILLLVFVIPGFLVDVIAINFQWYIFPETSTYLWMTSLGIPFEEVLFFITVPVWIIVLWKLSHKIF